MKKMSNIPKMIITFFAFAAVIVMTGCETVRSNSSYTITRMQQYTDGNGTYFTGASDASQNTFHAFVDGQKVTWTPHLPADAVREFKDAVSLIISSEKVGASGEVTAILENLAKSIANRTEKVEMLRYSLYSLSLLAINEDINNNEIKELFEKIIIAFGDQGYGAQ